MSPQDEARIIAYLDGNLPPGDLPALEQLLRASPEARRKLRIHATIAEELTPSDSPTITEELTLSGAAPVSAAAVPAAAATASNQPGRRPVVLPWAIACLTSLLALFFWWQSPQPERPGGPDRSGMVALLVADAAAEFAAGAAPQDVSFRPGKYRLTDGAIHLRFTNGTDLVMEAPADFTIDDAFHVRLDLGDLRAIVPPSGHGFTVAAGSVRYEDLGTEFGVSARPDGSSELHVFAGQVDAHPSDRQTISVDGGRSLQFDPSGIHQEAAQPSSDRFLTPQAISTLRWQQHQAAMARSEGLLAWFEFQDTASATIPNLAPASEVPPASFFGARTVSGRWPGKAGLLFDRDHDHVAIDLPGRYDELTLAVWIKPTSFDFALNALFNSDGWDRPGALHWQIARYGELEILTRDSHMHGYIGTPRFTVVTDRWQHLVATLSSTTGERRLYIDGQLIASGKIEREIPLFPGSCRLGNWLPDPGAGAPTRALRARIDEFAAWQRALTPDEIEALARAGRPLSPLESTR